MDKKIGQEDVMGLFSKMMNPMGLSMPNPFMPILDPEELEKKISELKTVEMWLNSNLGMLQVTIKTLEYQKALLTPSEQKVQDKTEPLENPFTNPSLWPWNAMQESSQAEKPPAAKKTAARKRAKK
jgi:hypothetical protein